MKAYGKSENESFWSDTNDERMNGHFHKRLESKEIQRSNVPNNGQMMTKMKVTEKLFIENEVIKRELVPLGDSEIIEIANRGVWQTLSMQESENFKRLLVDAHKSSRSLQVEVKARRNVAN